MSESLFLDTDIRFEKHAGQEVRLLENPDSWQKDIAAELFKQAPFVSDYTVNVSLEKVNAERGYALGVAEISASGGKKAVIPILVNERMLKPMDVFFSGGKAQPLTEERLRKAMFTTDPAHKTDPREANDYGLAGQLYPPIRTSYGFGNQVTATNEAMQKMASGLSLLEAISDTLTKADKECFLEKVAGEMGLRVALETNQGFREAVRTIVASERPEKLAAEYEPDVLQLRRTREGFLLKHASTDGFAPQEQPVSMGQAAEVFGPGVAQMQPGDTKTVSTNRAEPSLPAGQGGEVVTEYGQYTCYLSNGKPVAGAVLPLHDFDEQPLGMSLFVGDGVFAIQESIVGERLPGTPALPDLMGLPEAGVCVPLRIQDGQVIAYEPLEVAHLASTAKGHEIHATNLFGEPVRVLPTPGTQAARYFKGGDCHVPPSTVYLPCEGDEVELLGTPAQQAELEEGLGPQSGVVVKGYGGGEFGMSGSPLPDDEMGMMKAAEAEFLLVAGGLTQQEARSVLEAATDAGRVTVGGLKKIASLRVQDELSPLPLSIRVDLVKEAAVLPDYDTIDKVLALGFVNEENLETFKGYLPSLEKGVSKLAELLVASRVGVKHIPEQAVERAMKSMDKLVGELRA